MTIDTSYIWEKAAKSDNPYPILLLGRSEAEYFGEVEEVRRRIGPLVQQARSIFSTRCGLNLFEIGPGLYRFPLALKSFGYITDKDVFIALDIIDEFLERAPSWVRCVKSIFEIPDSTVDVAYSYCVFQHLPARDREFYAGELCRVVRPGGFFLLQVPRAESTYYTERATLHKFSLRELQNLFPSGEWWTYKLEAGNLERYFLLQSPEELFKEKREWFLIVQKK